MTTVVFSAGKTKLVATSDAKFSNLASGRNKKDEIDRVLSRNPSFSRYVALATNPKVPLTSVTLFKRGEAAKKASGNIDLAALFGVFCVSREVSDAIFIGHVGQKGLSAVVGVKDGVPFAMACGDARHTSTMAEEYYSMFSVGVVVYGDQDLFQGTDIVDLSPQDMLAAFDEMPAKEVAAIKKAIRVHYNGVPPIVIWGGVIVLAAVIGVKYYMAQQEEVQKERRRAAAIAAEQANNDPALTYEREQEASYSMAFKGCAREEVMKPVRQIMDMPLETNGWQMVEAQINCAPDGSRGGEVTYARRGGTNAMLARTFPDESLTFAPDLASIRVLLQVPPYEEGSGVIPAESLMDVFSFMVRKGTVFQVAKSMLDVSVALTDPAYINGAEPPESYAGVKYLHGNLTATGSLEFLEPFLYETSGAVRVSSIKLIDVKADKLPEFSLQGMYYVRKNPVETIAHQE